MQTVDDHKSPHSIRNTNTITSNNNLANSKDALAVNTTSKADDENVQTISNEAINAKPLEKLIEFLNVHYDSGIKQFAEEDNFEARANIKINLHNTITQLASDIIQYKKFSDIKIDKCSDEQLSIFITPLGTLSTLEVNMLLFFVIRDLCSVQGFDEITKPLITSMNTGQIYEFLGECNKNLSLLSDGSLKKEIERYMKPIFYNNIPENIKQTQGAFEYYYNILNFIALGYHIPEVFQKQASRIITKYNSFYSRPSIKIYEVEWTNNQDSFKQEYIEYPSEDTININNEQYTIKNIDTKIVTNISHISDVYKVQANYNITSTNLDELVASKIHSSSNLKNELGLRGLRLISVSSALLNDQDYKVLKNKGYFITSKPNNIYEIHINPKDLIEPTKTNISNAKGTIDSTLKIYSYIF